MTDQEKQVLAELLAAWYAFHAMPDNTDLDREQFTSGMNDCQSVIACRVARRVDPELWAQPSPSDSMPKKDDTWLAYLRKPTPKERIYVVAGDRKQYLCYLKARKLRDLKDAVYLSNVERFQGLISPTIVFTGSWTSRTDINEINDLIRWLGETPFAARIEYHPIG